MHGQTFVFKSVWKCFHLNVLTCIWTEVCTMADWSGRINQQDWYVMLMKSINHLAWWP